MMLRLKRSQQLELGQFEGGQEINSNVEVMRDDPFSKRLVICGKLHEASHAQVVSATGSDTIKTLRFFPLLERRGNLTSWQPG